jgi:hypothetical protein
MISLCQSCLHLDEQMEYTKGGAAIVPICIFGHHHFNIVKRYDQCRDFTDVNRSAGYDTDPNFNDVRDDDRPTGYGDDLPKPDAGYLTTGPS